MRRICKKYQSVFVTDEHEIIKHIFTSLLQKQPRLHFGRAIRCLATGNLCLIIYHFGTMTDLLVTHSLTQIIH